MAVFPVLKKLPYCLTALAKCEIWSEIFHITDKIKKL